MRVEDLEGDSWAAINVWNGNKDTGVNVAIDGGPPIQARRTQKGDREEKPCGVEFADPYALHRQMTDTRRAIASATGENGYDVRAPLPMVFADLIASAAADGRPLDHPFLKLEQTGTGPRYRILVDRILEMPEGFVKRLKNALVLTRDGRAVPVEVTAFRLSPQRPKAFLAARLQHRPPSPNL